MIGPADASLVAVRLPAGDRWLRTVADIWAAGDAVLPLPDTAPAEVITATLSALQPSALIDAAGTHALDGPGVTAGVAAVVATSGSTGTPKGAVLTESALEASARASLDRIGATAQDRWLSCLPLHHVAGLQVVIRARLHNNVPVMHEGFSVAAVAAERNATMVSLVPTMLRRLLDARADLRHLKCILLGGAAPGRKLLDDAAAAGVRVVTTYGMTETCGGCVYDGVPLDQVRVTVADDQRIAIAGPVLFSGYRLRDDATRSVLADGWLHTEDLGRWDDDGRLEVLGRADDVIITGGEKVAAVALADLLERHPAVAEAAAVGRDDPEWGQKVVAVIVPRGQAPTLEELRAFVREHAPAHAAPRELVIVQALPRLASGKVDRLALR